MKRIHTTHFAILGLLRIKPMSAYELVKFSKESIGLFWNESYGHIHKSIKQLELAGFVKVVEEAESGRRKIVFGITQTGCAQLDSWLAKPPAESVMRNELLMKLFVSNERHTPQLVTFLEEEIEASQQFAAILAGIKAGVLGREGKQALHWLLSLDYGERYLQMTIAWCQHALESLQHPDREC